MGQQKKHAKGRMDKYYHMAKEQGYRARSAFKLIQLNKKYAFLEKAKCLVDLCAAPGGWLQVAAKYMPKPSIIIGLDLVPIKSIPGVITHVEDITTAKCRATLKSELKTWKADVVLHDGAPNVGVSWLQDAFSQSELTLSSLKLATEFLVPGGTFVTKVFRSKDYNKLIWVFQQLFKRVEATKPASSRNVSAEIFVVCRDYLDPKKIDPRLLDPKWAFKEIDDSNDADVDGEDPEAKEKRIHDRNGAIMNELFRTDKRRRFRDGYEDGDYTLHNVNSVVEFVRSPEFLTILARSHELKFLDTTQRDKNAAVSASGDGNDTDKDKEAESKEMDSAIRDSPFTTDEIREYLSDLKVLGKREFKTLIAWRDRMRDALGLDTKASLRAKKREAEAVATAAAAEAEKEAMEDLDTVLEREAQALEAKMRRDKKKKRERKAKQVIKLQLGMATPVEIGIDASKAGELLPEVDLGEAGSKVAELFGHRSKIVLQDAGDEDQSGDEAELENNGDDDNDDGEYDSDDDRVRKLTRLEQEMEDMYKEYKDRMGERNPNIKAKKRREGIKAEFDEWYGIEHDKKLGLVSSSSGGKVVNEDGEGDGSVVDGSDSDMDSDSDDPELAELERFEHKKKKRAVDKMPSLDDATSRSVGSDAVSTNSTANADAPMSKKARVFYDNPIFDILKGSPGGADEEAVDAKASKRISKTDAKETTAEKKKKSGKASKKDMLAKFEDDDEGDAGEKIVPSAVPVTESLGSDDDGGDDDRDVDDHGFILDTAAKYTLAQQMISKSGKRDLIDAAYNRFSFNDRDGLPEWFLEDENRHNKPSKPITKEAVDIIRQRMRALDARPIKKVAEAKFRKQLRTQRRLEKMSKKADAMNDNEDMTEKSKLEAISKMVSKAKNKREKTKTSLVVAKGSNRGAQGRPRGVKGRYKMVDARLKKDARSEKARAGKKSKGKK